MKPRIILAHICYTLGDWISYPMVDRDWGWLYPIYNKLMTWSGDLDNEGVIWKDTPYHYEQETTER